MISNKITLNILSLLLLLSCSENVNVKNVKSVKLNEIMVNGINYEKIKEFNFSDESNSIIYATSFEKDSLSKKYYILDTLNKEIIGEPYWYDNGPDYFEEGLCRFKKNNKVGFLNKKGEIVIEPKYDYATYFINGLASVGNNCEDILDDSLDVHHIVACKKEGVINKNGEIILPIIYDAIQLLDSNNIAHVVKIKKSFEVNLNTYKDSLNKLELPYGKFYGKNGTLRLYPLSENNKSNNIYYSYRGNNCGYFEGLINLNSPGKFKFRYNTNYSEFTILSVTPGLCMDDNCKTFCVGSWGTYYKDKSKLISKD